MGSCGGIGRIIIQALQHGNFATRRVDVTRELEDQFLLARNVELFVGPFGQRDQARVINATTAQVFAKDQIVKLQHAAGTL